MMREVNQGRYRFPPYVQIRETIDKRIASGEWAPGGRIPPERELCVEFGASRMALRQAVGDLVAIGLLTRFQGKGTFVDQRKVAQSINPLQSFTVNMDSQGIVPGAPLIDLTHIPATRDLTVPPAPSHGRTHLPDRASAHRQRPTVARLFEAELPGVTIGAPLMLWGDARPKRRTACRLSSQETYTAVIAYGFESTSLCRRKRIKR